MEIVMIIAGIIILILVSLDMINTVIFIDGGGTISKYIAARIWKLFYLLSGKNGSSRLLTFAGGTILISLVFIWVIMIWAGYSLIFLSDPDSVVDATTKQPASDIGNIYYVGYTLTSLGNGDLKSGSEFWRIVSNIMGISSMFFVTLGISYVLPVLQSVIAKRSLAIYISKLGRTPVEIIENGWNGKDFCELLDRLEGIEPMIIQHSERHLGYPILHYFHSNLRDYSAPLSLAILDEAITIREVYEIGKGNNEFQWNLLRRVLNNYIDQLEDSFIEASEEAPRFNYPNPIDTSAAHRTNSPELKKFQKRRCKLRGLITKDGWTWDDILKK